MRFSYNWLKNYIKGKLPPPQKLAELLTLHSFEVKGVEKVKGDYVLDIDILPNRIADCGGHLGIARECSAVTNCKLQITNYEVNEDKKLKVQDFVAVEVQDKNACLRYSARVVTGVRVGPSPKWLQDRLENCGLQSINNIVDIANYVMLETGQPLHAFDFDKIKSLNSKSKALNPSPAQILQSKTWAGKQIQNLKSKIQNRLKTIIVRKAKKGEEITTLDDKSYDLDEDILIIADDENPLAIAGIKGGKSTGIDRGTKTIVLESANFNPYVIRKGSKKLNLRTDASLRFEHGLDPNLTEFTLKRAVILIQKLARGRIAKGLADVYPKKVLPQQIKLKINYVRDLLGLDIPKNEIIRILKSLDFRIAKYSVPLVLLDITPRRIVSPRSLIIEAPTWRRDISLPEDLIEEIGRIYGFERIPATFPLATFIPPKRNEKIFWRNLIKNILKELGFIEVYNYSFVAADQVGVFGYDRPGLVKIENPVSAEQEYLRPSLIPNLLKNVKENSKSPEIEEMKIFEAGKIFRRLNSSSDFSSLKILEGKKSANDKSSFAKTADDKGEKEMLAGLLFQKKGAQEGFYILKGVIDSLLNQLGISNIWYDDYQPTPEESLLSIWQKKKCAEIKVDGEEIGFLGEISKRVLDSYNIEERVFLFDLNFEKLYQLACEEHEYRPLSPYPAALRDIAVLVPKDTKVVEVLNKINLAGGKLVQDIDLFDLYEGEELPEGKKNLAFHIILQAEDHTLSSQEIDEIQQKIVRALEEKHDWEVRR